jgi:hypothetical protein
LFPACRNAGNPERKLKIAGFLNSHNLPEAKYCQLRPHYSQRLHKIKKEPSFPP